MTPRIEITDWVPRNSNTLRGFFTLTDHETGLVMHECSLHFGPTNDWVSLPCAPAVSGDQVIRRSGRVQYRRLIKIAPRERWDAFQSSVLEALRAHPEASLCWREN